MLPTLMRRLLIPLAPAALIAAPLATLAASLFGCPWGVAFVCIAGPIACLWSYSCYREDLALRPVEERSDPQFGALVRYRSGDWEARVDFAPTGHPLVVTIEAGVDGPSAEQRARFETFRADFAALQPRLDDALRGALEAGRWTLFGALLPGDPDSEGELIAACAPASAGGTSGGWYVTLKGGCVVETTPIAA